MNLKNITILSNVTPTIGAIFLVHGKSNRTAVKDSGKYFMAGAGLNNFTRIVALFLQGSFYS